VTELQKLDIRIVGISTRTSPCTRRMGRTGDRPPKLIDEVIAAKAMRSNPEIRIDTIAHRLGVSTAAARPANMPDDG
jgi:hypothetical protein